MGNGRKTTGHTAEAVPVSHDRYAAEVPHNFPCCLPPVPPLPIQFFPVEPHRAYISADKKAWPEESSPGNWLPGPSAGN